MNLEQIQQALHAEGLDGWLFYDFRRSNPIAHQVLKLPAEDMYTRRWFYFVPAHGTPSALISAVESHVLGSLPGERRVFQTWREMQAHLQAVLQRGMRIAMEYSPMNAIPYIARVDAGTLELVRSYGVEVVSSANLAQRFVAQLSDEQMESHTTCRRAASMIPYAVATCFYVTSGDAYPNLVRSLPTIPGWLSQALAMRFLRCSVKYSRLYGVHVILVSPLCGNDLLRVSTLRVAR